MTPLGKLLRNLAEKIAGQFYEGPEPPRRFAALASAFVAMNPRANATEWMVFAASLAQTAYRSGFTRGIERSERAYDHSLPEPDLTRLENERHDWEWHGPQPTSQQLAETIGGGDDLLSRLKTDEERIRFLEFQARLSGSGYRIVLEKE